MNFWKQIILEALLCSAALFAAHAFPLNGKVIEPAMVAKKPWAYPAGFLYYAAALAVVLYGAHSLIAKA